MSEIDFDELDRAVNDLMSNVDTSKRHEGLDDPEDKVVTLDSSSTESGKVASSPAAETTTVTPMSAPEAKPAPAQSSPLAVKRRGQFMDMVHPSSDMTSASRPVKRDGVSIMPPSETISTLPSTESVNKPSSAINAPANSKSTPTLSSIRTPSSTTVVPTPMSTPAPAMPSAEKSSQPIASSAIQPPVQPNPTAPLASSYSSPEAVEPGDNKNDQPEEVASVESEIPAEIVDEASSISSPQPLPTAPFLSDARVEKRPLGANSESAAKPPQDVAEEGAPASEPVSLPAELQGDVVAVEASVPLDIDKAGSLSEVDGQSSDADLVVDAGVDLTAQSIEQTDVDDQVNGSIYDTANYHQPIDGKKPEKKSSPLKWLAWFLVLLIVGVGAGVAYFFLTH
ncbi:hypothetical protein FBF31_03245 [Candidatus Saccharibacteria bacterium oral taxon 955]|nr:hypothetical protein FBF33_03235 [Candidatus Saccharibacteria bacterium oral taxon 955]QJU06067.1 hypothetical protein FBF31_03245 [Candidatus Saccharibacteria bacterium oral taxon 955]